LDGRSLTRLSFELLKETEITKQDTVALVLSCASGTGKTFSVLSLPTALSKKMTQNGARRAIFLLAYIGFNISWYLTEFERVYLLEANQKVANSGRDREPHELQLHAVDWPALSRGSLRMQSTCATTLPPHEKVKVNCGRCSLKPHQLLLRQLFVAFTNSTCGQSTYHSLSEGVSMLEHQAIHNGVLWAHVNRSGVSSRQVERPFPFSALSSLSFLLVYLHNRKERANDRMGMLALGQELILCTIIAVFVSS